MKLLKRKKIIYRFGFERKLRHLLIFCGLSLFCKPCKYEVEDFLSCLHSHLPILFYSTAQKNLSFDPVLEKEIEGWEGNGKEAESEKGERGEEGINNKQIIEIKNF